MKLLSKNKDLNIPDNIVLLLNNEKMRVYCWLEGEFKNIGTFIESKSGLEDFESCLCQFPNIPITLIVDYVGEYFRHETVPHVSRRDRKGMINRKLRHYFNTSQFRNSKIIGSIKNKRKEDKVLFMALTNTDIFLPWLDRLLDKKLPIKCISSVAFLMESLCDIEALKEKTSLLIVNVEPDGSFRQTYLENGSVLFSRTNPLLTESIAKIVTTIENQCVQSKAYLERIKLLSPSNKLEVYVFSPYEKSEGFDLTPFDSDQISYKQQYLPAQAENYGVSFHKEHTGVAELILSRIFLKTKGLKNVYCNEMYSRYFTISEYVRRMRLASYGIMAITLALLIPLFFSGNVDIRQEERYFQDILALQDEYKFTNENATESPIPPVQMQLIVDHYEKIESQLGSPVVAMQLVSTALTANPGISVSSFSWQLASPNEEEDLVFSLLSENSKISSILGGTVAFDGSFEKAQNEVNRLIVSLENLSGVHVQPILMPMDTNAMSQVSVTLNDEQKRTEFSLQLVYGSLL